MSRALERAIEAVFGQGGRHCATCGAPNPAIGLVVLLDPEIEILHCTECGGGVTSTGICLTPAIETDRIKIIRLEHDPPGLEALRAT